jgi:hypothetical protein
MALVDGAVLPCAPMRLEALLCALLLAGCPANDPSTGLASLGSPQTLLDFNEFVCRVEPVLIKRCSYLACHGDAQHALRIYSLGKLRLGDPTTRVARSNRLLTPEEVERNFDSAAGMVYGASASARQSPTVTSTPLLYKPLAAREGGGQHHGVAVFPTWPHQHVNDPADRDPEWDALVTWVSRDIASNPFKPDADCVALFNAMGLGMPK